MLSKDNKSMIPKLEVFSFSGTAGEGAQESLEYFVTNVHKSDKWVRAPAHAPLHPSPLACPAPSAHGFHRPPSPVTVLSRPVPLTALGRTYCFCPQARTALVTPLCHNVRYISNHIINCREEDFIFSTTQFWNWKKYFNSVMIHQSHTFQWSGPPLTGLLLPMSSRHTSNTALTGFTRVLSLNSTLILGMWGFCNLQ